MDIPQLNVVKTADLQAGEFFILHQGLTGQGVPAMAGKLEGYDALRLIPFEFPSEPKNAFVAIHENAFGGTALKMPDAQIEIDYRSASNSSGVYGSSAKDAITMSGGGAYVALHNGISTYGYLELATGIVRQGGLANAWMSFDRWRIVDGSEQHVELFVSKLWRDATDE